MKKRNARPLGELLSVFYEENPSLKRRVGEHRILQAWKGELLGRGVSHYTQKIYFKQNTLYVHLSSSVLRSELMMHKDKLIEKLNEHAQMAIVYDIVFR